MLTAKEIIEYGIIKNYSEDGIQQQGIDCRVDRIYKLDGIGAIPESGKTILPTYTEIQPLMFSNKVKYDTNIIGWMLKPGVYSIDMMEGVKMGNNQFGSFKTRSSLIRQGSVVESGGFDAGFASDNMGAMLYVYRPIVLAKGARVAQFIVELSNEVDNVYDGQFQGDKQRVEINIEKNED